MPILPETFLDAIVTALNCAGDWNTNDQTAPVAVLWPDKECQWGALLPELPIGWHPDLNDGVRLNIRPWVTAGVLRRKFTIHWNKDRGKNPNDSERINDLHFTRAEKLAARRVQ